MEVTLLTEAKWEQTEIMGVPAAAAAQKIQAQQLEVLVTPHLRPHLKVVTVVLGLMLQIGQLEVVVVTQHPEEMAQDLLQGRGVMEPLQVSLGAVLPTLVEVAAGL